VTLILTNSKMAELRDFASGLVFNPDLGHAHILCEGYSQENQKEIVLRAFESGHVLGGFDPRIMQVIDTDT